MSNLTEWPGDAGPQLYQALNHGAAAVGNDTKTMCQAPHHRISVDSEHSAGFELADSNADGAEDFEPTPVFHPET
jgi:hypothetical protein